MKHTMMVPDAVWGIAQDLSGMENPASWIRSNWLWPAAMHSTQPSTPVEDRSTPLDQPLPMLRDYDEDAFIGGPGRVYNKPLIYGDLCFNCGVYITPGTRGTHMRTGHGGESEVRCPPCGRAWVVRWKELHAAPGAVS